MDLQDDNIDASELQIHLDYSSLPNLNLSNETDEVTFQQSFLEIYEEPHLGKYFFISSSTNYACCPWIK